MTAYYSLDLKFTTSKAADTYGYNRVTLEAQKIEGEGVQRRTHFNGKFSCVGGGYDMIGTVLGDWLESEFQAELLTLVPHAKFTNGKRPEGNSVHYGLAHIDNGKGLKASIDGACGVQSVINIAEALGLQVAREGNKKGHTIGFFVERKAS